MNILFLMFDDSVDWQMSPKERLIITALLKLINPAKVLEIGARAGGFTRHLSDVAKSLTVVDIDTKQILSKPSNAIFLEMTSDAFFAQRAAEDRFDLIVIDGDHSFEGTARDLENALAAGKHILLHDTFNPECRGGYSQAINKNMNRIAYFDLDVVKGTEMSTGLWGGIGFVVSKVEE